MGNDPLILSNEEFQELRQFIFTSIGVNLTEAKRSLVVSRLSKNIRKLGLSSFKDYLQLVKNDNDQKELLFNLITTNVTKFFREDHHFHYLTNEYIPSFLNNGNKLLRIWSSACSSGEEPYSIAMTIEKCLKNKKGLSYKILASDINTEMLQKAKRGIYHQDEIVDVPYEDLKTYFKLGQGENEGYFKIKENIQNNVIFQRINLIGQQAYPFKEKVHIIFCRNVFIYFSKETQKQILDRFYSALHSGGILILGHSESIPANLGKWRLIKKTIYQKID